MEEGVDTVGNGVLLLFGGQYCFGNLGRRKVLTQLVTGNGVLLLFGGQYFFGNLGWRRVMTQ